MLTPHNEIPQYQEVPMAQTLKLKSLIQARLIQQGRSQGWLSRQLGSERGYVSRIVRGLVTPKIDTAYRIAAALHCTIEDLWIPTEGE
jgi:DNA-binding XRE family transcriptional regulator